MKKRQWDGWSSVLVALLLWRGYTLARTACAVTSSPGAVTESTSDPYEELVSELFAPILAGIENRLSFEAWADNR